MTTNMAGRWKKPDYGIRPDFNSSYDLIKHNSHVPQSPLYRPGQKQQANDMTYYQRKQDDDINKMASEPLPRDMDNTQHDHEVLEDPRYGSAQSKRHNPAMDNDLSLRLHGPSRDGHISPHANKGSWTDRAGGLGHAAGHDSNRQQSWTDRDHGRATGRMPDPRAGNNSYPIASGLSGLRHGGALLFIRFPTGWGPGMTDNITVACQAFLRSKTYDMGGKFLGIAKCVHDFGYPSGPREAIGVYHFPSQEKAKLFFQYDMNIRQPDFPPPYGHAEMWIVSNAYLPDNLDEYNTFLLSEIMLREGRDKREFFESFQKPFEKYLAENQVLPFVVCSYGSHDRESLRRHSYHHRAIVTCHLFKGINHLSWLCDQEAYLKFRCFHNQMADEKCMIFNIERDLCP